jgi:hypothetical protein
VGDSSTPTLGLIINSGATDTSIVGCQIRQHPAGGIVFAGGAQPQRCTITDCTFKGVTTTSSFTGTIVGTVLTASAVTGTITVGQNIFGTGVNAGQFITSLGSGTGGAGTYNVSSSNPIGPIAMTGASPNIGGLANWTPNGGQLPVIANNTSDGGYTPTDAATLIVPLGRPVVQISGTGTTITNIPVQGSGSRITVQSSSGGNTYQNGSGSGALLLHTSPLTVPAFFTISFVCDGVTWFQDGGSYV